MCCVVDFFASFSFTHTLSLPHVYFLFHQNRKQECKNYNPFGWWFTFFVGLCLLEEC